MHSFVNSKGKMAILHLEKYGQILYQKIALQVWVPTQQTGRDFKFSSLSYARFSKMCLANRWAFDMSNWDFRHVENPSSRIIFFGFWTEGLWTCRMGQLDMSKCPPFTCKQLLNYSKLPQCISKPF